MDSILKPISQKPFRLGLFLGVILLKIMTPHPVWAASINVDLGAGSNMAPSLQLILLITVLSLAPALLILVTAFTRIAIVLSFVRNSLGAQQIPPNQVIIGLSLFLTFFVMQPTWNQINQDAVKPYMAQEITQTEAMDKAEQPIRDFMFKQTREKDLGLFVELSKIDTPKTYRDVPTYVLIPSFVISELKTAFQMGFAIFIPFIIIDLVVSSVLMSMGMMMLPPSMISLPFKLLLFVMVDGWGLIVQSLVTSFS